MFFTNGTSFFFRCMKGNVLSYFVNVKSNEICPPVKHNNVRNISENHRTIPFELGFLFIKRNLQMKFNCPDTGTVRKVDKVVYACWQH